MGRRCTYDGIFDVKSKEGRAFYSRKGWFLLLSAYVGAAAAFSISNVPALALSKSRGPISKNLLCCGGRLEWMIFPSHRHHSHLIDKPPLRRSRLRRVVYYFTSAAYRYGSFLYFHQIVDLFPIYLCPLVNFPIRWWAYLIFVSGLAVWRYKYK